MRKVLVTCVLAGVLLVAVLGLTAALIPARPHEYRSEVFIELPVAESWRLLGDLSLAHHYVPGVVRTEVTTQRKRGIGASRRVYSSDTDYINETVTAWQEGRGFTLALHTDDGSAPAPFREAAFTY